MAEQKLTAQQRALLFGASTRQHYQTLGTQTVNGGAQMISFRVPKSRLMQGVKIHICGKLKGDGTATTFKHELGIYDILRRISIDFNNGFNPIVVSGSEMATINMLYPNPAMVKPSTKKDTLCYISADEIEDELSFDFMLDVPLTINYRDPVGLVLAQNSDTNIDIKLDFENVGNIFYREGSTLSGEYENVRVTPMITSFSIPSDTRAFPDLSVLKVCDAQNDTFTSGQNNIKLPVGMIYRKLVFKFEDEQGLPMSAEDINSNIELVLNTADTPYSITPAMLRYVAKMQLGLDLPEGVYAWCFDWQGLSGYGGSRDYIDTERVTSFEVRFNSGKSGKIHIIAEKLSRLVTA